MENNYGNISILCRAWRTEIFGAKTGKLAGRSIAVKDSIPVAGVPMRNGSAVFSGFTPDFDATIVTRVLAEGMLAILEFRFSSHLCHSVASS